MDLGTAIIVAAFGAAGLALAGHGTLAIITIRKAHREARADYTAKIEESRHLVTEDMTKIVDAKFKVLEDAPRPPSRAEMISDLNAKLDELERRLDAKTPKVPTAEELASSVVVPTPEEIAAVVRAAIPQFPSIADGMQAFLSSPQGGAWAATLAEVIGTTIQTSAQKKLEGVVGGLLRTDETRMLEVLRNIRFGNILIDGAWGAAMSDPQLGRQVASRIAKAFHAAGGLTNVLGNEAAAERPALEGEPEYV